MLRGVAIAAICGLVLVGQTFAAGKPPFRTEASCEAWLAKQATWKGVPVAVYGLTPVGLCFGKGASRTDSRGETIFQVFDAHLIGNGHNFHLTVKALPRGKWAAVPARG